MQSVAIKSIHPFAPVSFSNHCAQEERFSFLGNGREAFSPFFTRQYHVVSKNKNGQLIATTISDSRSLFEESLKVAIWGSAFFSAAYLVRSALLKSSLPSIRSLGENDLSFTSWMDHSPLTKYLHLNSIFIATSALAAKAHALFNPIFTLNNSETESKPNKGTENSSFLAPERKSVIDHAISNEHNSAHLKTLATFFFKVLGAKQRREAKIASLFQQENSRYPSGGEVFLEGKEAHHNAWIANKAVSGSQHRIIHLKDWHNATYASAEMTTNLDENELSISNLLVNREHPEIDASFRAGDGHGLLKEVGKKVVYSALRKGLQEGFSASQNHKSPVVRFLGSSANFIAHELLNEAETEGASKDSLKSTAKEATLELTAQLAQRLAGKLFDRL